MNFWSDEMKKSMDKDAFGLTFAQFGDWAERSSRKIFKRNKKERLFMDDVYKDSDGRSKVIPIFRKSRNRPDTSR
ncbi:MAG: hypothetical protein NTAFB09_06170 [Nitrosospira sp.]